jgi:hypothetical protein
MAMADNPFVAVLGLQIGMLGEEIGDLGLYGLRQQGASPLPENFSELIVEGSWLKSGGFCEVARHNGRSEEIGEGDLIEAGLNEAAAPYRLTSALSAAHVSRTSVMR